MDPTTARPVNPTRQLRAAGSPPGAQARLTAPDLLAEDVAEAVCDVQDGRFTRARRRLASLWAQTAVGSVHRSAVAHWLAAAESAPESKLAWDERALEAAEAADDWSLPFPGTGLTLGAVYPELHLELARDLWRLGSACGTLEHLHLARNAVRASPPGQRRTDVERQLTSLDRQVLHMQDGAGDEDRAEMQDWGWQRETEEDLLGFWDDEGTD